MVPQILFLIKTSIMIYIEKNSRLIKSLIAEGFRKTKIGYQKVGQESELTIGFGRSHNRGIKTTYYSLHFSIHFMKVDTYAEERGLLVSQIGGNVGNLMPTQHFYEWRLPDDSCIEYEKSIVDDIILSLKKYILPFWEKYFTLNQFIEAYEIGEIPLSVWVDRKFLAIAKKIIDED